MYEKEEERGVIGLDSIFTRLAHPFSCVLSCVALPFLVNTEVFLLPVCGVVFLFILNLLGYPFGMGFNASRIFAHLYFERLS